MKKALLKSAATLCVCACLWLCANAADYSRTDSNFSVGGTHVQSGQTYESFRNQVGPYGKVTTSNHYRMENGFAQTDASNPIKISDPYLIIRAYDSSNQNSNFNPRQFTKISKNTSQVSAAILVDHSVIPTASFDAFTNINLTLAKGSYNNTEVTVTGDLKDYLTSNFPNKYITVTIADAGSNPHKIIYVVDDNGKRIQLTNYLGQILPGLSGGNAGRISNVTAINGGYSFRVYKFSTYGLVTLNAIVWNQASTVTGNYGSAKPISVKVSDSQNQGVAGAPVIFVKTTGYGSLSTTNVLTDTSGVATTNFTFSAGIELNRVSASVDTLYTNPVLTLQTVDKPILVISSIQLEGQAPTSGGYHGNLSDVVPGSKLIYTVNLINDGNGTANVIEMKQAIPQHTQFYAIAPDSDVLETSQSLGHVGDVDYRVSGVYQANPPVNLSTVQMIRFNIPAIGPNQTMILKYIVIVN